MTSFQLLVVDDDEVTRKLLNEVLTKQGHAVALASSGEEAVAALQKKAFALVLSDIRMLDLGGMDVLRKAKAVKQPPVVVLMTGFGSMEGAIEAIKEGAFDYVSKPFRIDELKNVVSRGLKHWESLYQSNRKLGAFESGRAAIDMAGKGLIGKGPKIVDVYKTVARAALSNSSVLVHGESGTGKELVARAIHDHSERQGKRFVAVNCGALAENLLESELFGHLRGAFTGAVGDKKGLFEEASGGTLFLDEVGDISLPLQIKLLRVLQEGEVRPVGANENRRVDVRVIAATHRDLEEMVRSGKFREDLFYRLKVIGIELPPLRERLEDLPDLVNHFLARYSEKNRKKISHISDEAMALLRTYPWPGNVRELEHAIERAVALGNTSVLYPEDFPPELSAPAASGAQAAAPVTSLEDLERAHILKVLQETGYNKSRASEVLGIDRATLYRKANRYGIDLRAK